MCWGRATENNGDSSKLTMDDTIKPDKHGAVKRLRRYRYHVIAPAKQPLLPAGHSSPKQRELVFCT